MKQTTRALRALSTKQRGLAAASLLALTLFIFSRWDNDGPEYYGPAVGLEGFEDDDGGYSYGALELGATSRQPLQPNEMCSWDTAQEAITFDKAVEKDGWPTKYEHMISESRALRHVFCPVCGAHDQVIRFPNRNLREEGRCSKCSSFNRLRQIAEAALPEVQRIAGIRFNSLKDLVQSNLAIYNTQCAGVLHNILHEAPRYVCSEFISTDVSAGSIVHGVQHEDLQRTSFNDNTFDLVISGEVLSHIPSPYQAHYEVRRILKPGGSHVFTVPFSPTDLHDQVRASVEEGRLVHHIEPPIYAGDAIHKNGILLYTIFGKETVDKLCMLDFNVTTHHLHVGAHGIIGKNAWVFVATKRV
ncbi:hypothetical protein D9Q98_010447 [Chlorella vulgaris]|uniref:Methyltransferase type 11 domain-containing protein n=1 Tax=Chlorella vulgaris TaxID=3077 RepID=A0A9D4YY25_CHLVU|nr:hypothetical protein D9Q98_010447 [Chlorella vulgaris]